MAQKLPVVVIVGRPNVGKSTLFNRIIGKRVAVVEDTPGITRDRLYAEAEWGRTKFQLVDTGGILFSEDDPLIEQIRIQAEIALAEADVVLFVVDVTEGINPGDWELANRLRGVSKPIYLVANKSDNQKRADLANEFYALGIGEIVAVSGLNGNSVAELLDLIVTHLPSAEDLEDAPDEIRLAIIGRPNVGKSSLLNAFTGEQRAIVSNIPGTTRDAIDTLIDYKGEAFRLIDTAGIRRRGKTQGTVEYYMVLRATRAIERAECALVLVDGTEGLTDGDKRIAKMAHDEGRACVIAVNKWDMIEPPDGCPKRSSQQKKDFTKIVRNELPELSYAPICYTSAKESAGLPLILDRVKASLESWKWRISTGQLNKLIQDAMFERPYTSKGRQFKVYYCTQVGSKPPVLALFCNDPDIMHFSYQRYLENSLRKQYPLVGTPVRIVARSSHKRED